MHRPPNLSSTLTTLLLLLFLPFTLSLPQLVEPIATVPSNLGINCRGSFYCLGQDRENVTGMLLSLTASIPARDIYGYSVHIACLSVYDPVRANTGAFCLFMQGFSPHQIKSPITGDSIIGVQGSLIKEKLLQLYNHGCRGCGSVPLSNDNNPNTQGILTINYVQDNAGCSGHRVCPPTIAGTDAYHNPLFVVNQTADGTQACAGPGSPVITDKGGAPLEECGIQGFSPVESSQGGIATTTGGGGGGGRVTMATTAKPTVAMKTSAAAATTSSVSA